jgi:hypothetical protein
MLEVILCRDPIPGQGFGAGQIQIAPIVSLGVLSVPRWGAGESRRLGCSRHCVGHVFCIAAQLCRRWMTFRSVFHFWSVCRTAEAVGHCLEESSTCRHNQQARCRKGRRSNFDGVRGGWARRSIIRGELAERIQVDHFHIGSQSGVFKLPDGGAVASGSNSILLQWRLY